MRRQFAVTLLGSVILLTLCGCSVSVSSQGVQPVPVVDSSPAGSSPSGRAPASASARPSPSGVPYGLAETFPLGAGMRAHVFAVKDPAASAGTITVPGAESAYRYWTLHLPRSGYTVDDGDLVGGVGHIRAHGHGCRFGEGDATVRLTFDGSDVVQYTCEA